MEIGLKNFLQEGEILWKQLDWKNINPFDKKYYIALVAAYIHKTTPLPYIYKKHYINQEIKESLTSMSFPPVNAYTSGFLHIYPIILSDAWKEPEIILDFFFKDFLPDILDVYNCYYPCVKNLHNTQYIPSIANSSSDIHIDRFVGKKIFLGIPYFMKNQVYGYYDKNEIISTLRNIYTFLRRLRYFIIPINWANDYGRYAPYEDKGIIYSLKKNESMLVHEKIGTINNYTPKVLQFGYGGKYNSYTECIKAYKNSVIGKIPEVLYKYNQSGIVGNTFDWRFYYSFDVELDSSKNSGWCYCVVRAECIYHWWWRFPKNITTPIYALIHQEGNTECFPKCTTFDVLPMKENYDQVVPFTPTEEGQEFTMNFDINTAKYTDFIVKKGVVQGDDKPLPGKLYVSYLLADTWADGKFV